MSESAAPTTTSATPRRRWLWILAALLVPAIPVLLMPAGDDEVVPAAARDLGAAVRERIASRPQAAGAPVALDFGLEPGAAWSVAVAFTSERTDPGAAPDDAFREALAARSRTWIFSVIAEDADGWEVAFAPESGAGATGLLAWSRQGELRWRRRPEGAGDDARAHLAELGVWFPDAVPSAARVNERLGDAVAAGSFQARAVAERLELELGKASAPPAQGFWLEDVANGEAILEELAHVRRSAAGARWAGGFETAVEGRFRAPAEALELVSGRRVLRERFDLEQDETTTAVADHLVVVEQTATRR